MTMNTTWGDNEHDRAWKSDEALIRKTRVRRARLLAGGTLEAQSADAGLIIRLPSRAPDPIASVIAVELEQAVRPAR